MTAYELFFQEIIKKHPILLQMSTDDEYLQIITY
jgi:hypothetical protein